MKKLPVKRKSITNQEEHDIVELPSNNAEMEKYVEQNRTQINEKIVENIDFAVNRRLGGVELFCFKDSSFVVILNRKDFVESLENIFEYSLDREQFEVCGKVKKIMDKIAKLSYAFTYKKIKK